MLQQAEERLRRSGRFADVEVRKRFRSIDNPSDILVIVLVDEHAGGQRRRPDARTAEADCAVSGCGCRSSTTPTAMGSPTARE